LREGGGTGGRGAVVDTTGTHQAQYRHNDSGGSFGELRNDMIRNLRHQEKK
jgi:hypothetical protein